MIPQIINKSDTEVTFTADGKTTFRLQYSPFRIENYVDGKLVVTVNDQDTLYFEANTGKNENVCEVS